MNFIDKIAASPLFSVTMHGMKLQLLRFLDDRRGGSAPEYALILVAVAGAVAVGLALFGSSLGNGLRASALYVDRVAMNFGPDGAASAGAGARTAATAAATPASAAAAAAGKSGASHGKSGASHGHHGGTAGQSGQAPGQGGTAPGNSENAPGQTK
jgi:Flp pilus assembly pilin Flp